MAAKLAAVLGCGEKGRELAAVLAREGIRGRVGLRRPAVLERLPREARARVLYGPFRAAPLEEALDIAAEVGRRAGFGRKAEVRPVGSMRRLAPRSRDLDFLVLARQPDGVLGGLQLRAARRGDRLSIAATYASGERRRSVVLRREPAEPGGRAAHYRADFFLATRAEAPFALFHHSGPAGYNIRTRAQAKRQGWRLNQYGVFSAHTGRPVRGSERIRTERDLAAFLGVTYYAPEGRR